MKKNQSKLVYWLAFLVAGLLVYLVIPGRLVKNKKNVTPVPPVAVTLETAPGVKESPAKKRYLRDPFEFGSGRDTVAIDFSGTPAVNVKSEPSAPAGKPAAVLVLQGFFESGGRIKASVNNEMVGLGDSVDGWKVEALVWGQVTLTKNGRKIVLKSLEY